jgi:hypothetical protein
MHAAAPPRGWRATQLHAAAPTSSAKRALRICAARPRSAQHNTRFTAAVTVRAAVRRATRSTRVPRVTLLTLSLFFPARPGRTRASRSVKALQPAPRGGALAASAGEADDGGEGEADDGGEGGVSDGAFFNRLAELHSLSTLLAGPPRAVLVVTGPPSCGKSGVRAPSSCGLLLGLR